MNEIQSLRPAAVAVHGLVKHFGRTVACDGADFSVAPGEIHGILGPNGSGKTTIVRILLGLLHPDAGRVRVLGLVPWQEPDSLHRRVAFVQGEVSMWPNMTGGEVVDLIARMHGGIDPVAREELLELFDLDPSLPGHAYDKTDRQKVALVAALASRAELLLLDEPLSGPARGRQRELQDWLATERGERTVVFTSHVLAEVEALADRVTLVDDGRVLETGTLGELRHLTRTALTVELERPDPALAALPAVHSFELRRNTVRCEVDSDRLDGVLRSLLDCGMRSLTSCPATLEELLTRRYRAAPGMAFGSAPVLR